MTMHKTLTIALNRLLAGHAYTARHGLAKGLKRRGGLAFLPTFVPRSTRMLEEERFLANLDLDGQVIYDVGGDQGIYTIFFAKRVGPRGKVITFEPNPASYKRIMANVELNGFENVDVLPIGLGREQERLSFVFPALDTGRGTAERAIASQILREKGARTIEIEVKSLDSEIRGADLPKPDFVKIDVEGLEMDVLLGMSGTIAECKPRLFIEIHGADMQSKLDNVTRVVAFLRGHGYALYHVESKQRIDLSNAGVAKQGHLYGTPENSVGQRPSGA